MRRQLRAAHLALSFLTILPVPPVRDVQEGDFARATAFYPLAGYAVGAVPALLLWLPMPLPDGVRAALALTGWLALTGLLHFDGLVDSADALFAMKSPAERLKILRDVHVGAFGLATGTLTLLLWWSLLSAPLPAAAPVVAAVAARTLVLLPMHLYPAVRQESLGAQSRAGSHQSQVGWALLLALPALLWPGAWLAWLAGALGALLAARFAARRLGSGLNGDTYGMIIVTVELCALLALAWGRT